MRQQLAVDARRQKRRQLHNEDRVFRSVVARIWRPWHIHLRLGLTPRYRWHRTAWRRYWTWKSRRRAGHLRIDPELRDLIRCIARENPRWGAVRSVGQLRALGFTVSSRTVHRYRRELLRQPPSQSWRTLRPESCEGDLIWAVHCADGDAADALRGCLQRTRSTPNCACQRDSPSHGGVGLSAIIRGAALGDTAATAAPAQTSSRAHRASAATRS